MSSTLSGALGALHPEGLKHLPVRSNSLAICIVTIVLVTCLIMPTSLDRAKAGPRSSRQASGQRDDRSLGRTGTIGSGFAAGPAFGAIFRTAEAAWMRKEAGDFYIYVSGAMHLVDSDPGTTRTMGWAAKNACEVTMSTKHMKIVMCRGRAQPHVIPPEHFEVDLLLQDARLDHEDVHLSWLAERVTEPDINPSVGSSGVSLHTRVSSWAPARGQILGVSFGSKTSHFGLLTEGVFTGVIVNLPTAKVWLDANNVIRYRFRIGHLVNQAPGRPAPANGSRAAIGSQSSEGPL